MNPALGRGFSQEGAQGLSVGRRGARSALCGEWRTDSGRTSAQSCRSHHRAVSPPSLYPSSFPSRLQILDKATILSWAQGHQGTGFLPNLELNIGEGTATPKLAWRWYEGPEGPKKNPVTKSIARPRIENPRAVPGLKLSKCGHATHDCLHPYL